MSQIQNDQSSVLLLVIADEAPSVLAGLPLLEEGLPDGFQLCQLQTDLFQVKGAAVVDLFHWKWVHARKCNVHQLSANRSTGCGYLILDLFAF